MPFSPNSAQPFADFREAITAMILAYDEEQEEPPQVWQIYQPLFASREEAIFAVKFSAFRVHRTYVALDAFINWWNERFVHRINGWAMDMVGRRWFSLSFYR